MKKILLFILLCPLFLSSCGKKHETIFHAEKDSTCLESGSKAYYECLDCHKYFLDDHKTEIEKIPLIAIKQHPFQKTDDNIGHFYSEECSYCGLKKEVTELPIININTLSGDEIMGNKENAEYYETKVSISNCEEEYIMTDTPASVKVRGNYTANYDKKPYRIKFETKQVMLGLNNDLKAKNWVLLADYKDRSLLRNMVAFTLGNEILSEYTSDYRYVEVYVNNTYRGLYLLCEQQEVNKGRINISEPEKGYEGVDIGYLVELDSYYLDEAENERFEMTYRDLLYKDGETCSKDRFVKGYTIKSDVYSVKQKEFIQKTLNNIFEICYDTLHTNHDSPTYKTLDSNNDIIIDTTIHSPEEALNRVIDITSLIDVFILNEICLDMDIAWSSFYMYYDMNGSKKLTFTAPWDFDSALGYSVGETDILITSYEYNSAWCGCDTPKNYTNPWLLLFATKPQFNEYVSLKWERISGVSDTILNNIDLFCKNYQEEIKRNFEKWPMCNTYEEAGHGYYVYNQNETHYSSTEYLKTFITNRFTYLNEEFSRKKYQD